MSRLLVVAAAVVAGVLPVATPASANPRDEQDQVEREVAEAAAVLEYATEQAQQAAAEHAEASAALPAAEARVDETRGEVIAAQVHASTAQQEAEQAEEELAGASERYEESTVEVADAREATNAFATAAYKGSGLAAFNLVTQARGPTELVERLGYIGQVGNAKRAAFDELTTARLQARQAENEATLAHERAEATRLAAELALAQAEAAEAEAELAAAEAEALAEASATALAAAEAEREESLRRYEDAEAEAARVEAELQQWEATQQAAAPAPAAPGRSGGLLRQPTQGWMSSPYGMRFDPFFRVWQLHAGMDIAADGGAPIYAAAEGTVIRAGWNGGYGNFTCLSHGSHQGSGLSTCYAHQSEILVGDGQWVEAGAVIGRVGSTGASTGSHLHFEVRLDGSPTDPTPFLP